LSILLFVEKLRAVKCAADAVTATEKHMNDNLHFTALQDSIPGQKTDSFDIYLQFYFRTIALKYATVTSFHVTTNVLQSVRVKKILASRSGQ
jgi:hypothetical protein